MCLDVGAVSEKCRSIAPMCLDVGAVSEKCRSIAPMCLDVGAVSAGRRMDVEVSMQYLCNTCFFKVSHILQCV